MEDKEEVVYIDETSFNLWQQPSKCWLTRDMSLSLSTMRGKSLTLIAGISEKRGLIHYEVFAGSNTADTFITFLVNLKLRCRQPAVVVQDNLSVHKASKVMQLYGQGFRHMFLPTYSSVLNPIEKVWNIVKQEWRQT